MPRMKGTAMIAALPTALYELAERAAYRVYMTDSLFAMGENKRLTKRYIDLITNPTKKDSRTGQEIADDLFRRMGFET